MAAAGLAKVVDFQDLDYGRDYAYRLRKMLALDQDSAAAPRMTIALTRETAKYLANAMCYDDIIRVADAKTRGARFARVHAEVKRRLIQTSSPSPNSCIRACAKFWEPCRPDWRAGSSSDLVVSYAQSALRSRPPCAHRRLSPGSACFMGLAGLRGMRRKLLRHEVETAHLAQWLAEAERLALRNYDLAVEVIRCRRLIKGYSDTYERGQSKFDRVLSAVPLARTA